METTLPRTGGGFGYGRGCVDGVTWGAPYEVFRTSALGFPSGEQLCVGGQAAEETGQTGTSASLEQAMPTKRQHRGQVGKEK